MEIEKLFVSLMLDAKNYTDGLSDAQREGASWSQRMRASIGGGIQTAGRIATGALLGIGTAAVGAFALAGNAAISMNATLETSTLQFETLMGDADRAQEHVANLFEFAKATPFETQPIIDASRVMQTFGGDALNTMDNLTLMGDAAAATNAPIEDVAFWSGRMYAALQAGKPIGEAVQNLSQLAVISPQAANEMEALMEAGASADEVFGAFQEDLGRFSGAMEKQAGTWSGLKSTISDALNITAATALRPFFDLAKGGLEWFANFMSGDAIIGGAEAFAGVLTQIGDVAGSFFRNMEEGMSPMNAFIEAIWDIAPPEVLDALVNFRDNILPGLMAAIMAIVTPVVDFVTQNVELKDVLIALGLLILSVVVPAILGIVAAVAPVIAAFLLVIGAVALVRQAWEENWGGIQEKTAVAWEWIKGIFAQLQDWVINILIPVVQDLYERWVNEWWPAISQALSDAWNNVIQPALQALWTFVTEVLIPKIQELWTGWTTIWWPAISRALSEAWENVIKPALDALWKFITETLVPTIKELYEKWVNEWWPQISTALQNAWTIIEEIWTEVGRWINDNIVPWIEFLHQKWVEEIWPAIIKIIEDLQPVFERVMTAVQNAVQPVKDLWDNLVDAVVNFWDWITSHDFSFNISIPDLPDWAVPGSPLPIHTAWKNFNDEMNRMEIKPRMTLPDVVNPSMVGAGVAAAGGGASYSSQTTVQLAAGQDPLRALRASRHLDKLGVSA